MDALGDPSDGVTVADQAYSTLQATARQVNGDSEFARVDDIQEALDAINGYAVETLQALCTKHEIAEAPSTPPMPRSPVTIGPTVTDVPIPSPGHTVNQANWIPAYRQLRCLEHRLSKLGWRPPALSDVYLAVDHMSLAIQRKFKKLGGNPERLRPLPHGVNMVEQKYRALTDMLRDAEESDDAKRALEIRQGLESIYTQATEEWNKLTTKYGALDVLSSTMQLPPMQLPPMQLPPMQLPPMQLPPTQLPPTQLPPMHLPPMHLPPTQLPPMQLPPATIAPTTSGALPVTIEPPVSVLPTTVPPPGRLNIPVPEHPVALAPNPASPEPAGRLVHTTGVPGPPLASGLPGPSLAGASGAAAGDLGRGWLDPPATATTAAQPVAIETIVTPSLAETTSFWLQPADPWPAALGYVPFDSGLHHAGETVQPPPVTTAPALSRAASATDLAALDATEIDRLLGTGAGVSYPGPPSPPSASGRAGAGAGAPSPGADPWGIRPPGMSGEPDPAAFDPWSAPPGPGSRVAYTGTIRTPVLSAGAPPGWQGAETHGFARAASGAVELPFARREAIARLFGTEDALRAAEYALRTVDDDGFGWSAMQWPVVLADLLWLNANFQSGSAAAAAMVDVDWRVLEALARFLEEVPPPSP